ncbi:MAG: hypothetical protein HUJ98_04935, partial [Bacteroidaceae bacterium]|nr:hypothetical protein [Bacteroidaceae bacterium]
SGKSVFLHSIITNSVLNYSPDELELFLLDFSGVEFNVYALHNLPHAKVIAPEAEREFGLSILREIKEEGNRRMELCSNYEVSNIVDLKEACPGLYCPRQLVIIDEFQKLFEKDNDPISREAMSIIHIVVKEYRKFGINLILATQKLSDISSTILPRDLIANRVVFKCSPTDVGLIGMPAPPQLKVGECIYNMEAGVANANVAVQTFYISKSVLNSTLDNISDFAQQNPSTDKRRIVFRSKDLPEINIPVVERKDYPYSIDVCFGESIAISDRPVAAALRQESNNNILIIGGEQEIAERIAIYANLSIINAHTDQSAKFYFLNFIRQNDSLFGLPEEYYTNPDAFESIFAYKEGDVIAALEQIKSELDERRKDEEREQSHIYLSIYAMQLASSFRKGGRRGDDVSEAGQLLRYILANGPLYGIFTILQVDNYQNLMQLENVVPHFAHRVALQMGASESNRILDDSDAASHLLINGRPATRYRAYYYNPQNRILEKFKPYK